MKFEHTSHIHIEWEVHKRDLDEFSEVLASTLSDDSEYLAQLDALNGILKGAWNASIGDWKGIFKFTAEGQASWHSAMGKPAGGTGQWQVTRPGRLSWTFGDMRTFVTDFRIDKSGTEGEIQPAGQGWFSMTKR